jgi:nicotinate-nucleotide pyrophosphorylase
MPELDRVQVLVAVTKALAEDLAAGEPPQAGDIPEAQTALGAIVCRGAGVVAGLPVAAEAFARVGVRMRPLIREGSRAESGRRVAEVGGSLRAMLAARPTALRLLERLSSVASGSRPATDGDPLEAYAATFSPGAPVSGDNGPRFELEA